MFASVGEVMVSALRDVEERWAKGATEPTAFESPLEEYFAENLTKYLDPAVQFAEQVEIPTLGGLFRLDFLATMESWRVAFECDGRDFHRDAIRDECRDSLILGTQAVDVIYRLRGSDLFHHLEDCLFIASQCDPALFSERGRVNLERLASDEARAWLRRRAVGIGTPVASVMYPNPNRVDGPIILIERHFRGCRLGCVDSFFTFAQGQNGGSFDGLLEDFLSKAEGTR